MKGKIIWPEVSSTVSLTIPDLSGEYSNDFSGQDAYQGGLICQSIVGFHGRARKLLIDDITSLTSDELSEIFDTPPGSFLLEKMAKNIPDKKFIEIIKHFPIDKIAFGRFGSRAVEGTEFLDQNYILKSFLVYRLQISDSWMIDVWFLSKFGNKGLWKNGSIKLRAALCEMLKEVHVELGQSQFGRHVNHKLRVTEYVKGRLQNNSQNTNT